MNMPVHKTALVLTPLHKTCLVLAATISGFGLGIRSVIFSGSWADWTSVITAGGVLILSLFLLIRDFWKSNA
jgi:hypothetical protein